MKNKLILIMPILIFLIGIVSAANYYVTNSSNCPLTYLSQGPFTGLVVCGETGGTVYFTESANILYPTVSSTTTGTGGTNYACVDATCDGGYIIDCYYYDGTAPHCDNLNTGFCDRNSTCFNKHVQTTCKTGAFVSSNCSSICTTNYFACDGSTEDADGCEIQAGVSCGAGTGTVVLNQCYSSTAGNCTSTTRLDCDNSDGDNNPKTCNVGNGCEILIGGSCTVGSLTGVYGSTCTGSSGTCIVSKKSFIAGNLTEYQTNATEHFLWGTDYGTIGDLLRLNNTNYGLFRINASGCVIWVDGTSTCTKPISNGADGTGGWINTSTETNTSLNVNIVSGANVTANWGFLQLTWTYLRSIPNIFYGLWNGYNANNLLISNGTAIGYNETVFNNSIRLIASIYNETNFVYANFYNKTSNINTGSYNITTTSYGFFGWLDVSNNITANFINANLSWERLFNYPVECPAGSAITQLNDSVICTSISSLETDPSWTANLSGGLSQNLNLSLKNITGVDCIVYKSGGKDCST